MQKLQIGAVSESWVAPVIEVNFDEKIITYKELLNVFWSCHNPTTLNRQGPDIGDQYRSEIFYLNDDQKGTAEYLIDILKQKGYKIATKLTKATTFWKAEDYHQQYYSHKGSTPYCHKYVKRF